MILIGFCLRMSATGRSYTQIFFLKFSVLLFKIFLVENWWKKITFTDEKIFRVHKAFDRKNNSHGLEDFPPTAVSEKGCQYREEDYENKILS